MKPPTDRETMRLAVDDELRCAAQIEAEFIVKLDAMKAYKNEPHPRRPHAIMNMRLFRLSRMFNLESRTASRRTIKRFANIILYLHKNNPATEPEIVFT